MTVSEPLDTTLATSRLEQAAIRSEIGADALWTPVVTFGATTWQRTDERGVDFICENLEGWADLPESDAPVIVRVFDHGAWTGRGWYGPRRLVFTGSLVAPSREMLQAALHEVRTAHAGALTDSSVLAVDELDGLKRLGVRAAAPVLAVAYITPTVARVTFELVAAWPIKRSPTRTEETGGQERGQGRTYPRPDEYGWWAYGESGSTGDLRLINAGNAPIRPTFELRGPVTNPRIISAALGRRLEFAITLADGDTLTIDPDTHAVLLNGLGNRRYVLTTQSAWFDIEPGVNVVQFRSDTNTGLLRVTYGDGWW